MTDSAQKPTPRSKSFRVGVWAAVTVGIAALLSAFVFPLCSILNQSAMRVQNSASGGSLFSALKKYAQDHEGHFPAALGQLVPQYLTEDALDRLGYMDAESRRRYEWIYFPGATLTFPHDTIILAAPGVDPQKHHVVRQVIRVDGYYFLSEQKFREQRPDRLSVPPAPDRTPPAQ